MWVSENMSAYSLMDSSQHRLKIFSEEYRRRATSACKGVTSWILMTIKSIPYSSYMVACQQQTSCIMEIDFKLEGSVTDQRMNFLYTAKIPACETLSFICRI
jgi:hypothetical protein